ncbi:J domain-containing protein [Campylobacter sp. 2457A]|uniref:J domain-containing protein n=1 Tax=Campylobacter sp. 2457A TaxID=2735784 RepID=UPI00301BC766|nr:DnaJ domain-containing protein [Campylobacter sp. 2457A]
MKMLLYMALGIIVTIMRICVFVYCIVGGLIAAQEAYHLRGVLGEILYFLGFDKKSLIAAILVFFISAWLITLVGSAIIFIAEAILSKLIDNIWQILGRSLAAFVFAPYYFSKAFIYYPIKCSTIVFKYLSWNAKFFLSLIWVTLLTILLIVFFYFDTINLIAHQFSGYYKEIINIRRINYNYIFNIFGICVAVNIISLGVIFLFKKTESLLYIKAYKKLNQSKRYKKEQDKDFSSQEQINNFEQSELDMLLKIFDLTQETLNKENLKKHYKELARQLHPDLVPLHRKKEAHNQFVELQKNYDRLQKYLKE